MTSELASIETFLATVPPLDRLEAERLTALARKMSVRYFRAGQTILEAGSHNDHLFIIRSGAVELRLAGEELTARMAQGGIFAYPSLLRGGEVNNTTVALEDTLVYMLPAAQFHSLRDGSQEVREFFAENESERLRSAVRDLSQKRSNILEETSIAGLQRHRPPVSCHPQDRVAAAAMTMSEHDVSTLVVCENDRICGILTDKDLRNRVLAAGIDPDTPVHEVMTRDPVVLPETATLSEAMTRMTAGGFRHVPVVSSDGDLRSILSATDILAFLGDSAVDTGTKISKARSREALIAAARRIPEGFARMQASGFHASHVMRFTSALGEAVHRRAAQLAEIELGPPPCSYAVVVFGSLARGEQLVGSDQDNGLILSDDVDGAGEKYFDGLGEWLSDLLHECGFVYCNGGIMAKNAAQRLTLSGWRDRFDHWIDDPDEDSILRATIFFDMRAVSGEAELARHLHKHIRRKVKTNSLFLSYLARDAQRSRIPLGIFRNLVLEKSSDGQKVFDAKGQAILPIIDIARTLALAEGSPAVSTIERLEWLAEAGHMARSDADSLRDAMLFVNELRIAHHAEQLRSGKDPDNAIAPGELSPLERDYLKDSFSVIRDALESVKRNMAGGIV
ncbi:putative nucleotidyltransferase substrate binding domain-containing protein [Qipengyuania sphaerica]|uniref:putative nucleotidyltransferase substrate binding domain-containing protein n=1 Tax=Qipengyuania sphaerica TaxID=2867243 RepID=UPI001C893008|nr:putative nucleotidyltransferase substrate binding domain-containing protein [Qipengyuania sphaerica]MBX7541985.1 CBS domain-containing protein [Qipengyuania sphaerica]